ncbi:hypothetical protein Hanom_Chr06g00559301 [Helianthus anomalus]
MAQNLIFAHIDSGALKLITIAPFKMDHIFIFKRHHMIIWNLIYDFYLPQ